MEATLLGITIDVRLEQPEKARCPMKATLLGITIVVRLEQPRKAESPINATPSGIRTLVRFLPEKAEFQIPRTGSPDIFAGITTTGFVLV